MAKPIVLVDSGGIPVTESENGFGLPVELSDNDFGMAVVIVDSGGLPVVGSGPPSGFSWVFYADPDTGMNRIVTYTDPDTGAERPVMASVDQ